jgi:hypothetical protein
MHIRRHTTRSLFDRYNIVCDQDLAAERMERHLESLGTPGKAKAEKAIPANLL